MTEPRKRRCIARGCKREIAGELPMCGAHWAMVPGKLQEKITILGMLPTAAQGFEYWRCCSAAISEVADRESKQLALPF